MLLVTRTAPEVAAAVAAGVDGVVLRASLEPGIADLVDAALGHVSAGVWIDIAVDGLPKLPGPGRIDAVYGSVAVLAGAPPGLARFAWLSATARPQATALDELAADGFAGVVLGAEADEPLLLRSTTAAELGTCVEAVKVRGLQVVLAGRLEPPDIPRLLALRPDAVMVDGAARRDGHAEAELDPDRLHLLRDLMHSSPNTLAAPPESERDTIFVRDWEVAIHVGAYGHERGAAQRVRFTVEAEVQPRRERAADLRDVVSYDLITDAIGRATAGHVDLVETLAADVAASVLGHPRIFAVDVTVEKLDLGPGRMGCRLRRRRRGPA